MISTVLLILFIIALVWWFISLMPTDVRGGGWAAFFSVLLLAFQTVWRGAFH